jgi:hypothetical protein
MPVLGRSVKNQGRRAALWRCSRRAADLTGGLRKIRVGKFIANGQAQLVDRAALLEGNFAECIPGDIFKKHVIVAVEAVPPQLAAVSRGPLICYFSDTGTTVRLYVTSCTRWPKKLESDSPWKCSMCAPGLSGGRDA